MIIPIRDAKILSHAFIVWSIKIEKSIGKSLVKIYFSNRFQHFFESSNEILLLFCVVKFWKRFLKKSLTKRRKVLEMLQTFSNWIFTNLNLFKYKNKYFSLVPVCKGDFMVNWTQIWINKLDSLENPIGHWDRNCWYTTWTVF